MKERPILFSAPMVRAILDGRKTQTRRVLNPQPIGGAQFHPCAAENYVNENGDNLVCRLGKRNDRLWVRENWRVSSAQNGIKPSDLPNGLTVEYQAGYSTDIFISKWRPSIFMPRWASRLDLEITGVRVERLHDISEDDVIAEGLKAISKVGKTIKYGIPDIDGLPGTDNQGWHWVDWSYCPRTAYRTLWEKINGTGSWDANPWVWVIEFKRLNP